MKALVKYGNGLHEIEVRDTPRPKPRKDELLIKVIAAGICGTDLHIMQGEYPCDPPIVLGHEYTGIVEGKGEDVQGFENGDQVISVTAVVTCGHCYYCRESLYMLCNERKSIGSGVDGAMAEYLVVPARLAYKVPEQYIGSDLPALSEPYACCARAVIEKSPLKAGDVAVISGPGTIGLITAQLCAIQGAFTIVSGTADDAVRLKLAKEMGAGEICASKEELEQAVLKHTEYGADVVYECAGARASAEACIDVARKSGHYAQVGLYGKPVLIDVDKMLMKELTFSSSYASEPSSWDRIIQLMSQGRLYMDPLVSARVPLEDWKRGFDMALNRDGFKIFITP